MKHAEHIVAIHAGAIKEDTSTLKMVEVEIKNEDIIIGQRKALELQPEYRQVIPYLTIENNGKYSVYARTTSGGEARLHGAVSMGYGGHFDLDDVKTTNSVIDLEKSVKIAALREIEEEVNIGRKLSEDDIEILPFKIVSSETPVDSVHIGLVAMIHTDAEEITSKEDQIEILGFKTPQEILDYPEVENWTKGLAEFLLKK